MSKRNLHSYCVHFGAITLVAMCEETVSGGGQRRAVASLVSCHRKPVNL